MTEAKSTGARIAQYGWERRIKRQKLCDSINSMSRRNLGLPTHVRIIGVALVNDKYMEGAYVDTSREGDGEFSMKDPIALCDVLGTDVIGDIKFLIQDNLTDEQIEDLHKLASLLGIEPPRRRVDRGEEEA